jgi:hypothetical protein
MNLKLVSFNANNINDTTNFLGFISDNIKLQGSARVNNVSRSDRRPAYAAKTLSDYQMKITIQMRGTIATQLDTLKAYFDVEDVTPRKLICKDIANSDKTWYVYATAIDMPKFVSKDSIEILLSVADPVWYEETESSDTWAITASGQTDTLATVGGNVEARPRFVLTPTSSGTSRYAYRQIWAWRNPNAVAMLNYPLNIVNTVWDTAALVALSGVHVTINDVDGITTGDTTITYDGEAGTFPSSGLAYLESEQISYTGKSATELTGVTRGVNGTTAATHANDIVIYSSKVQADGDDLRVFVNGTETNRWLQGMNSANTKVWISLDLQPGISLTTGAAIADSGAVSTITIASSKANDAAIKKLQPSGTVSIENELYTYTGVNVNGRQLTGCTRAVKGTSAAAHVSGTTVYWIEHEIWIYYGSSSASAPVTDDTNKPMIDLTSTNVSWVYTSFWQDGGMRSGAWSPSLVKTANTKDPDRKSAYYTGNRLADADPATEMGAVIKAWKSGSVWKAENATVEWALYNPATFTEITATGEKYRATSNWPAAIKLLKSTTGKKWVTVWTEATPTAADTWESISTHSAVSLSTGFQYVKMSFSGTIGSTVDNYAAHEIEAATLTLASATVPQCIFTPAEQSCYFINAKISNNTSGEWIKVTASMPLSTTLTIDCENKKAYTADNAPVSKLEFSSVRKDWLNIRAGANTLQFDDTGTTGLTFVTNWRDRNS